ncbi:MAG: glycosyltransferase family 1 protein [Candidatus Shapirobacteria bacterium]
MVLFKKVKIAIDVSPLSDQNSTRGVGYYTRHLVDALQHETKTNPEYLNWQIDLITNHFNPNNYQLIHYPYFDPFFLTLPYRSKTPFIVTVHDLIPRQFKSHYPVGIKGEIKWLIQKYRLNKAKYLITDSHCSKFIINNLTGYPTDKIYVTYLSSNADFKPLNNQKDLLSLKNRYHLPDKFILYVGDVNWNKNLPTLVSACLDLKFPLAIAGSAANQKEIISHPWNHDLIWLQKQASLRPDSIILTGFVSTQELVGIYNLATIYCQPSFAEGFGLPLVEAMKTGCPVVYGQESCLDEIMDQNGVMFDPHSIADLKLSLKKLWSDKNLLEKYRSLGLKRAKFFDWQKTALQTLAVYKLALFNV